MLSVNKDPNHDHEQENLLLEFNSITQPDTETSVLILENDAFTSLALETQCSVLGVKCSLSAQFDEALE